MLHKLNDYGTDFHQLCKAMALNFNRTDEIMANSHADKWHAPVRKQEEIPELSCVPGSPKDKFWFK